MKTMKIMKTIIRSTAPALILALLVVFGAGPMCAAENEQNVTIRLVDAQGAPKTPPSLAQIEGRVEVVKTQTSLADGLRMTVVLANRGDEPVRFLDPRDSTQVMLLDAEGWPIDVPKRAPRSLVNSRTRGEDPAVITLQPGQEHRVQIQIKEVLPRANDRAEARKPIPVPGGAYDVKVTSTIIAPEAAEGAAHASRTLTSEQFIVHLGV